MSFKLFQFVLERVYIMLVMGKSAYPGKCKVQKEKKNHLFHHCSGLILWNKSKHFGGSEGRNKSRRTLKKKQQQKKKKCAEEKKQRNKMQKMKRNKKVHQEIPGRKLS